MTLGLDSAFLTAARFIASFLLEKILLRFLQLPGQSLAPGVPAGTPGLRGDSRGIAIQNDKRCPRRAGLSALSHRDAEPNPKPPAKTRFTCDTWCE